VVLYIAGLTGEKTIYRRRAEKEPEMGTPQAKPKRLKLVIDVSGSMYRLVYYFMLLIVEYVRNSWYVPKNSVKRHFFFSLHDYKRVE
jgi:hypothetical protein